MGDKDYKEMWNRLKNRLIGLHNSYTNYENGSEFVYKGSKAIETVQSNMKDLERECAG